VKRVLCTYA